jgi:hypothetical protein
MWPKFIFSYRLFTWLPLNPRDPTHLISLRGSFCEKGLSSTSFLAQLELLFQVHFGHFILALVSSLFGVASYWDLETLAIFLDLAASLAL